MEENLSKKTKQELIQMIEEMRNSSTVINDSTPAIMEELAKLKKVNAQLRSIISASCEDHCPHHGSEDACRNCGIKKRLAETEKF